MSNYVNLSKNNGNAVIDAGNAENVRKGDDVHIGVWCGGVSTTLWMTADEARCIAGQLIEAAAKADDIRAETVQQRLVA